MNARRLSLLLTHIYTIQDWCYETRVFIDHTGIYDGLGWVFAEEIEEVQQMTDGRWGRGCKLNAIYCCVYQRTGCQQGWRERGKGLQPDIMMKSQNKPGKADIIQHTDISHMKVLEGKNMHVLYIKIFCCFISRVHSIQESWLVLCKGKLTCLLMLKTTFPQVWLKENIPKQNVLQMVYLYAFGHVDAHFSGNIVGSFLHSACTTEIVSIITFLPWALLSWYKQSQNRFFLTYTV